MAGNYPPGVDNSHRHFNPEQIECPGCGRTTVVGPECEHCAAPISDDAIHDQLADQEAERYGV